MRRNGVLAASARLAASCLALLTLAVAPALDAAAILSVLRAQLDPVFLPRRLRCVESLPRNDTGKLPRQGLLDLLRG